MANLAIFILISVFLFGVLFLVILLSQRKLNSSNTRQVRAYISPTDELYLLKIRFDIYDIRAPVVIDHIMVDGALAQALQPRPPEGFREAPPDPKMVSRLVLKTQNAELFTTDSVNYGDHSENEGAGRRVHAGSVLNWTGSLVLRKGDDNFLMIPLGGYDNTYGEIHFHYHYRAAFFTVKSQCRVFYPPESELEGGE